ncbi:MAG: NAD(P)H-dependent oxidoreductase subunit E [Myxococcota bacterium]|nr:NAD(P)H-dependent oxidoreductase subunit E [Myxococcota bacterium]
MDLERVDEIAQQHGNDPSSLVQVLLAIQRENHWLPQEALRRVGEKLGAPMSRIRHIATFYKAFSMAPKGRHEVQVCMGTACHVRGAPRILDTVQDDLGIRPGETDATLKFSLDTVNCLGCCALGPVLVVDGRTHGKLSPAKATEVLRGYE